MKSPRKQKQRQRVARYLPIVVTAIAAAGLLLCLLSVGIAALSIRGCSDVPRPAFLAENAGEKNAAGQSKTLVVFDEVLPGADLPAAVVPPPAIVAAPAAGPPVPPPQPKPIVDDPPAESVKAAWTIPADPGPKAAAVQHQAGLRVPLPAARIANDFLLKYLPLMADLDGPFALFFPPDDRSRPSYRDGTPPGEGFPPAPLVDLRSGKQVGTFGALSPYWRDARLSPTGEYLVGPESAGKFCRGKPERNTLFVWKRGGDSFTQKLTPPGPVAWLEFVAADHLAVLVFDPKPVVQIWNVSDGKVLRTVRLTAEPFPSPGAGLTNPDQALHTFFSPRPLAGAVSPGGRLVALGNRAGVTLVDVVQGKEIGTLPIPGLAGAQANIFRGMSFHPQGDTLYALALLSTDLRLYSWSVTDGRRLLDITVELTSAVGPPLPGPEQGTIVIPGGHVGSAGAPLGANYVPPHRASRVNPAAIIETRAGSLLAKLDYCVLRWSNDGPVLAAGGPKQSDAKARPEEKWDNGAPQEVTTAALGRPALIAAAKARAANLAARPEVVRPIRTTVKRINPEPPGAWTAPPPVRKAEPGSQGYLETDFPAACGAKHAAVLRYHYQQDVRERFELHLDRYDLGTDRQIGSGMRLWPWARDPGLMKPHDQGLAPPLPVAALSLDGSKLAVCDPADRSRVDVWADDGRRLVGFHPAGRAPAIDWLGWSPHGRLLTVANGSLVAWEVPSGKAEFEVAGGYVAPAAQAADRTWLAVAAGVHVDLLDSSTGVCLARCRAGGVTGTMRDIALSSDGRRLAIVFAGPGDPKAGKLTAQLWDLATGTAELLAFGTEPYYTSCWVGPDHFATFTNEAALYDLTVRYGVAVYQFPPAPAKWHGAVFARAADGRLWFHRGDQRPGGGPKSAAGAWWAVSDSELLTTHTAKLDDAPRESVFPRRFPVRVEADLGASERGKKFASQVAELLRKQGFSIGPKGWHLRVTHRVTDTGKEVKRPDLIEVPEFIPAVQLDWVLFDADGNRVWERQTAGQFGPKSKYWGKPHFNLGGSNVRDAIADEILDTLAQEPPPLGDLPAAYLKIGRTYLPIPQRINPIPPWPAAAPAANGAQ